MRGDALCLLDAEVLLKLLGQVLDLDQRVAIGISAAGEATMQEFMGTTDSH